MKNIIIVKKGFPMKAKEFKVVLKNKSGYERELFIEARNCWQEYGDWDKMIECLEEKGFKDARYRLSDLSLGEEVTSQKGVKDE
jgi:hypothetical protein